MALEVETSAETLNLYPTFDGVQQHMTDVFGERNGLYLPDIRDRVDFFEEAAADLMSAVRHRDHEREEIASARLVSRLFCVANGFDDISVGRGMEAKFPSTGCVRCQAIPCICGEQGVDPLISWSEVGQRNDWSIREWQEFLEGLYGEANASRGIKDTIARLFAEVVEVRSLVRRLPEVATRGEEGERIIGLELADLSAWSLGAATLLDVDVQDVLVDRYGQGCSTCSRMPCECPPEVFDAVWSPIE